MRHVDEFSHGNAEGEQSVIVHADRGVSQFQRYGLVQLFEAIGVAHAFAEVRGATLYYGADPELGRAASVWIPSMNGLAASAATVRWTQVDGVLAPHTGEPPARTQADGRFEFDLGWSAAFWLTMLSEARHPGRDEHGRPPAVGSLLAAHDRLERPPVEDYARLLSRRLAAVGHGGPHQPRWPNGKRYAVALTHDVDAPERPNHARMMLRRLLLGGASRRESYWGLRAELSRHGLAQALIAPITRRFEWDFSAFTELERKYGLVSAFYFASINSREGHPLDVPYDIRARRYRRLFDRLTADGWEIGLHASYLGGPAGSVRHQRDALRRLAGQIEGLRHHYLRLSPGDPLQSLAAAAEAGLGYDTSVGFNDAPGFRAGTALPFEPLTAEREGRRGLVELPMTIADMHLPREDVRATVEIVLEHLEKVRGLGGLAVLNWHVGNWRRCPAWRESYRAACARLAEDEAAWVALPSEVADWWSRRSRSLEATSNRRQNAQKVPAM